MIWYMFTYKYQEKFSLHPSPHIVRTFFQNFLRFTLDNFQMYSTVLLTNSHHAVHYIPKTHLSITLFHYPFCPFCPSLQPLSLTTSLFCLCQFVCSFVSTCKWHAVFLFCCLWQTLLTIMPSRPIHAVSMARFPLAE